MCPDARAAEGVRSPLTGTQDVSVVRRIATQDLIEEWRARYQIDIADEFHGVDEVLAYRCNDTGLVFFRPIEIAGSANLYRELQRKIPYYVGLKWEHHQALQDLRSVSSVLEIGCADGSFLKRAAEAGIEARGIELNPDAVEKARTLGLSVELMDVSSAAERLTGHFGGLCCFQVLEHVSEPGIFLNHCVRLLKPGGILIASVPNAEGFLKYYHELLDLPPHHMSQWKADTFAAKVDCKRSKLRSSSLVSIVGSGSSQGVGGSSSSSSGTK